MLLFNAQAVFVPLGICVALPVLIVWIVFRATMNSDNKRAAVLIEAIKANNNVDTADLAKAFQKPRKSEREILNGRLLRGCIWGSLGLIFTICSIIFYPCGIIEDAEEFSTMLLIGLCMMGIGASYLAVYFTSRKNIEAEEKANKEA